MSLGFDLMAFFHRHHGVYQLGDEAATQRFLDRLAGYAGEAGSPERDFRAKVALLEFFSESQCWEGRKVQPYSSVALESMAEKQRRVHMVVDYIAAHSTEIGSLDELAGRFYMSKSYLCRIYKEVTSFTVTEHLNMYRIAASKELLMNPRYSMTEIANRLGYGSLTYFERVFKKIMGSTPLQYRKNRLRQ